MTQSIEHGAHEIAWVGTKVRSHMVVPRAGTWEVIDHPGCEALGGLRALTRGEVAPLCPACDAEVRWQLAHLAPNVASDHKDVGPLP